MRSYVFATVTLCACTSAIAAPMRYQGSWTVDTFQVDEKAQVGKAFGKTLPLQTEIGEFSIDFVLDGAELILNEWSYQYDAPAMADNFRGFESLELNIEAEAGTYQLIDSSIGDNIYTIPFKLDTEMQSSGIWVDLGHSMSFDYDGDYEKGSQLFLNLSSDLSYAQARGHIDHIIAGPHRPQLDDETTFVGVLANARNWGVIHGAPIPEPTAFQILLTGIAIVALLSWLNKK